MTTMTILRTNTPTYLCGEDCIEKFYSRDFYYGEKHSIKSWEEIDCETIQVCIENNFKVNRDKTIRTTDIIYFNPEDISIDEWDGIFDD